MGSCLSFTLFFFFIHLSLISAIEYVGADTAPTPQSLPVVIKAARGGAPPKPSVAVIFGILTTFFSLTFLLLLYAKHCRRGVDTATHPGGSGLYPGGYPIVDRRNSGIDRAVIDSLPVFRFASLRGLKDGLECAVCLNRFEPNEVLRLLPKCKHAFHVECVDTWLDAHSTCPLCRYRVDPEDILLVEDIAPTNPPESTPAVSRVSGRHSFAGNSIAETPKAAAARRSLDSWSSRKKKPSRGEIVEVGCFDRPRKDDLLLPPPAPPSASEQRRLEHRIIIAGGDVQSVGSRQSFHRWSDVQRPDLLFLQSEMILSRVAGEGGGGNRWQVGAINGRCVSEITGVSRYSSNYESNDDRNHRRRRQEGAVSRWTAWISQSRSNTEQQQQTVVNETTTSTAVQY